MAQETAIFCVHEMGKREEGDEWRRPPTDDRLFCERQETGNRGL